MLTTEEMNRIVSEYVIGKPLSINTAEAKEFRERIEKEVDEIKAAGHEVHLPSEHPDPLE